MARLQGRRMNRSGYSHALIIDVAKCCRAPHYSYREGPIGVFKQGSFTLISKPYLYNLGSPHSARNPSKTTRMKQY